MKTKLNLKGKPSEVRIDRSKWRSGGEGKHKTGKGFQLLLNPEGFYDASYAILTQIYSVPDHLFMGRYGPALMADELEADGNDYEIGELFEVFPDKRFMSFGRALVQVNDDTDPKFWATDRESALIALCKSVGITLTFEGEY